jgi:hypothetical protein
MNTAVVFGTGLGESPSSTHWIGGRGGACGTALMQSGPSRCQMSSLRRHSVTYSADDILLYQSTLRSSIPSALDFDVFIPCLQEGLTISIQTGLYSANSATPELVGRFEFLFNHRIRVAGGIPSLWVYYGTSQDTEIYPSQSTRRTCSFEC